MKSGEGSDVSDQANPSGPRARTGHGLSGGNGSRVRAGNHGNGTAAKILKAGEHLLGLINDFLDISKIEAGGLELNPEPMDLKKLVNEIEFFQDAKSIGKDIALTNEIPDDLPFVTADRVRLRQVLLNLITNGIKFTENGGKVVVGAGMRVGGLKSEAKNANHHGLTTLTVWVKDTGIGIPANMLGAIFDRFEQVDKSGHRSGTGLGLSISQRLVELQGGKLWVKSEEGKGSTFYFTVPVDE